MILKLKKENSKMWLVDDDQDIIKMAKRFFPGLNATFFDHEDKSQKIQLPDPKPELTICDGLIGQYTKIKELVGDGRFVLYTSDPQWIDKAAKEHETFSKTPDMLKEIEVIKKMYLPQSPKIHLLDDNPEIVSCLRKISQRSGLNLETVLIESPEDIILMHGIPLVVSDSLGGGWNIAYQQAREMNIPFVLTSNSRTEVERAREIGIIAYDRSINNTYMQLKNVIREELEKAT